MKTYRQREKQGTKVVDATKGPDEAKIKVRLGFLFNIKSPAISAMRKTVIKMDLQFKVPLLCHF